MTDTYLIVGLGNPGDTYARTRHNAGRLVLSAFLAGDHESALTYDKYAEAQRGRIVLEHAEVDIVLPETYMNVSGKAVRAVVQDRGVPPERVVVIHDDIDLPIGSVRVSFGRGSGGHNGVTSIINALKTKDFVRIRIGVAPISLFGNMKKPQGEGAVARYLLSAFSTSEQKKIEQTESTVRAIIETLIRDGREVAMNRFN